MMLKDESEFSFLTYYFLSSTYCTSDEMTYEAFMSLLANFLRLPKADFKIVSSHIEIFACKKFEVVEEMFPARVGDLHIADKHPLYEKLYRFHNFLVLKPKVKNNSFIQRLVEKNVSLIEIDKPGKANYPAQTKYFIASAKNVNLIIQHFLDYILGKSNGFEVSASFPFLNAMSKRIDVDLTHMGKSLLILKENNVLSDRFMRSKFKRRPEI